MDGKIIQLAHSNSNPIPAVPAIPVAPAPVPEIVEKLESILAEAKAGRIQAIGIAAWTSDNAAKTTFHVGTHYFQMRGCIDWLGDRLKECLDNSED
jgi:hypothetical protein